MQVKWKLALFPLIGLIASGCVTFLEKLQQPGIETVEARVTGINFDGIRLAVDIDVYNPYSAVIQAMPVNAHIEVNEQKVFSTESVPPLPVKAKQSGRITFPAYITYADLARLDRATVNLSEVAYRVYGYVETRVAGVPTRIPFSHRATFPVLRPPALSTLKVKLADVSLSKAKIIADAEIDNPNIFDLGIGDLSYILNLGTAEVAGLKAESEGKLQAGKKGTVTLTGEISAGSGLINLLMKGVDIHPEISASGFLQTPYGEVKL